MQTVAGGPLGSPLLLHCLHFSIEGWGYVPEVIKTTHLQKHVAGFLAPQPQLGDTADSVSSERTSSSGIQDAGGSQPEPEQVMDPLSVVTHKVTQNEGGNYWKGYFLFLF